MYHNCNLYYLLLLLLSGDITLNPGSFHNLQPLDHDEWNIFKKRGLHLFHLNINSLLPKINELRHIARLTNAAVIGISESKLDDSVPTSEIQIDENDLLCCDRDRQTNFMEILNENLSKVETNNIKTYILGDLNINLWQNGHCLPKTQFAFMSFSPE